MTLNSTPLNANPLGYSVPSSETIQGKRRVREYHEALGAFIDMFSRAEGGAEYALRFYAGVSTEVALAVFSGIRAKEALTFAKKLAAINGCPNEQIEALNVISTQFQIITGVRNDIVHMGASSIADGEGIVSNALKRASATYFPISPELLRDMTADLRKISLLLYLDHVGRPEFPPPMRKMLLPDEHAPWRYKHLSRPL